jgi:hypothetical protein
MTHWAKLVTTPKTKISTAAVERLSPTFIVIPFQDILGDECKAASPIQHTEFDNSVGYVLHRKAKKWKSAAWVKSNTDQLNNPSGTD